MPQVQVFTNPGNSNGDAVGSIVDSRLLNVCVGPSRIRGSVQTANCLSLGRFNIDSANRRTFNFFRRSALLQGTNLITRSRRIQLGGGILSFSKVAIGSCCTSIVSSFLHRGLLSVNASFAFRAIVSSPSGIRLLHGTRRQNFQACLCFMTASSPLVGVSHMRGEIHLNNRPIPRSGVIDQCTHSLSLLLRTVHCDSHTCVFSGSDRRDA